MALIPENDTSALDTFVATVETVDDTAANADPSKTYALDFAAGTIGGYIDDDDALRQYVYKALMTARSRFLIYDDEYGSELEELIADNVSPALFDSEVERIVYEAIAYDDRIMDVSDITTTRSGDVLTISFTITKVDGSELDFTEEVTT